MKTFFASLLGTLVGIVVAAFLVIIIIIGMVTSALSSRATEKPFFSKKNTVLHIKLDHEIAERGKRNPLGDLDLSPFAIRSQVGLDEILECFEKAKADSNIKGIYLELTDVDAAMATIEEIRNGLLDFKSAGKFIISYSEIYSQKAYYLASVADEIFLNPQGGLEWKGLSAQVMFYKGALDKLQIDAQVFKQGKFKSAIEPFDLDKMSPENRAQTMKYIGSIWNHMLEGIAKARKVSVQDLNRFADDLSLETPEAALDEKMVDGLKYEDEVIAMLINKLGVAKEKDITFAELKDYVRAPDRKKGPDTKDKIAVVYAVGDIQSGEGDDETIGSDRIAEAIREARMDSTVKAIVLRVNSPGGSALASDVMWREVALAKKAKPVIVSMGDYAASGGYYIACAADAIIAQPTTITGSIGVFGVLPNAQGFFNNKLGITVDTVNTNKHSDMGSLFRPVKSEEQAVVQRGIEKVYHTFKSRVAEGRKLTIQQVDDIGQGRVWSGVDAKSIGLVDELGGINTALKLAAKKAKIDEYHILSLPKEKDPFKSLFGDVSADAREQVMREQLGMHYDHFRHMKDLMNIRGVQARMPYDVIVY
jgi:protease IV